MDDGRGDAIERLDLPRLGDRFRQARGHDGPRGLLRHRGQELEILQGVGGAAAFRSEDDDADHAGTPAQGRDQGHRRRRRGQGGGDVGGQRHGDVVLASPGEQR